MARRHRPSWRPASAALGLEIGRLENRHAAAARPAQHRFCRRRAGRHASPRSTATTHPVPFSFSTQAAACEPDHLLVAVHDRARARRRAEEHREEPALQRAYHRGRPALLPVARGQGDAVPAPRAAPAAPRARGARLRVDLRQRALDVAARGRPGSRSCDRSLGSKTQGSFALVTPLSTDFVQPTGLTHGLESRHVPGLFLAGQVNGTSGYEEAAAQGLLAGINAARRARRRSPVIPLAPGVLHRHPRGRPGDAGVPGAVPDVHLARRAPPLAAHRQRRPAADAGRPPDRARVRMSAGRCSKSAGRSHVKERRDPA